jgi:hypothetical protein
MANNFVSYSRFTALPPNIADFGSTVEELKAQSGKPDANPILNPMAATEVSAKRLALSTTGSDKMRLGLPTNISINPYEGPKPASVLMRSALQKLKGGTFTALRDAVQRARKDDQGQDGQQRRDRDDLPNDPKLLELMDDSLNRVISMNALAERTLSWITFVETMALSSSRG